MKKKFIKKVIQVVITKNIEVQISNDRLSTQGLKEFSECIYETENPDDLFYLVAEQVALYDATFVEGIGPVQGYNRQDAPIICKELFLDVESEII